MDFARQLNRQGPLGRRPRRKRAPWGPLVIVAVIFVAAAIYLKSAPEPEPTAADPAAIATATTAGLQVAEATGAESPPATSGAETEGAPKTAQPTVVTAPETPSGGVDATSGAAEPELKVAHAVITHSIEADLAKAIGATDAGPLAQVVKRVLVWWMDPRRDLRKGDVLDVVWQAREDAEPLAHAVRMKSEKHGWTRTAVWFDVPGERFPRWVEPDRGMEVPLRLRATPVKTYEQITSLVNDGRHHRGVDFKAPEGTPIVTPFEGVVTKVNWATRGNGNCVKIEDLHGWEVSYLHLSEVADGIRPGKKVSAGTKLGAVGNTGHSFAPHLHYQIEKGGRLLDPFEVQDTWRKKLDPYVAAAAKARQAELLRRVDERNGL